MSENMIAMFGTTAFFVALLLWIPLVEGTCSLCGKARNALRRSRSASVSDRQIAGTFAVTPHKRP